MRQVTVLIFHPQAGPGSGPRERRLVAARARLADRHAADFKALGAGQVRIISGPPDGAPFGARLAGALADVTEGGLVVLGSGAIPLARRRDLADFVACAAGNGRTGHRTGTAPRALANNRFSADILAVADAGWLLSLPATFEGDNALPRWLAEQRGVAVGDLHRRGHLGFDLDSPLDLVLLGSRGRELAPGPRPGDALVLERIAGVRRVLSDPRAEVVVAGRTSAATLAWLEGHTRCRVRALVEERGLRASARLPGRNQENQQRPPRSVLGALLDRDGPQALGARLAELGDAAIIDSRVLLAHRLGPDESSWPGAEARFASDLLEPAGVDDPWLADLTRSAVEAPIPVLLGGHSLVGPGIQLIAGRSAR